MIRPHLLLAVSLLLALSILPLTGCPPVGDGRGSSEDDDDDAVDDDDDSTAAMGGLDQDGDGVLTAADLDPEVAAAWWTLELTTLSEPRVAAAVSQRAWANSTTGVAAELLTDEGIHTLSAWFDGVDAPTVGTGTLTQLSVSNEPWSAILFGGAVDLTISSVSGGLSGHLPDELVIDAYEDDGDGTGTLTIHGFAFSTLPEDPPQP